MQPWSNGCTPSPSAPASTSWEACLPLALGWPSPLPQVSHGIIIALGCSWMLLDALGMVVMAVSFWCALDPRICLELIECQNRLFFDSKWFKYANLSNLMLGWMRLTQASAATSMSKDLTFRPKTSMARMGLPVCCLPCLLSRRRITARTSQVENIRKPHDIAQNKGWPGPQNITFGPSSGPLALSWHPFWWPARWLSNTWSNGGLGLTAIQPPAWAETRWPESQRLLLSPGHEMVRQIIKPFFKLALGH